MKPLNSKERKLKQLKFIGFYFISIAFIFIVLSAIKNPVKFAPTKMNTSPVVNNLSAEELKLMQADAVLHNKLLQLYKVDISNPYSINATSSKIDSVNQIRKAAANALQITIDSIKNTSSFHTGSTAASLTNIVTSFQSVLKNYTTLQYLKTSSSKSNKSNGAEMLNSIKLQTDLDKSNTRVTELENQLKMLSQASPSKAGSDQNKIIQENQFLSASLSDQVNKNARLSQINATQKLAIDKLNKQIDAFRKFTGSQFNSQ